MSDALTCHPNNPNILETAVYAGETDIKIRKQVVRGFDPDRRNC